MTISERDVRALREDRHLIIKELPDGKVIAVVQQFASAALVRVTDSYIDKAVKRSWDGWEKRFCYAHFSAAILAGLYWDGEDDPPGDWVKDKSPGQDRLNPRFNDPDFLKGE
jgi:hypothetical protein